MAKYIKKPIPINAEQYKLGLEDGIDSIDVAVKNGLNIDTYNSPLENGSAPYILTMEGKHYISKGDYIITGIKGEKYPCKKDIFEMTYELIT